MNSVRNRLGGDDTEGLGKNIRISAVVLMIMVVLSLIFLVSAIVYAYMKSGLEGAAKDKATKIYGGLAITSAVIIFLTSFVCIWQIGIAANVADKCLGRPTGAGNPPPNR